MKQPLFQQLNQLATDRWARQGVRTLLRAAWIGASIWCIGLGGALLWGWPLRPDLLGALALAVIGVAVLLLLRRPLPPHEAARRLDRRFHLDEQLATAVEVAGTRPPPRSIAARLVAQSSNTAGLLSQRIARRQRPPWNEALTLGALLPVALGLYILSGMARIDLGGNALPLPPLAAPQDSAQQFPEQPRPPDQQSQVLTPGEGAPVPGAAANQPGAANRPGTVGDPRARQALADALRDQGATRSAAEALDRGDLGGAAQRLRELADQADQLSQSTRDDLADSLRGAADRIQPINPALADQLRRSANGLEQGGPAAAQALDDLARAIERLRSDPSLGADGHGQPNQADQGGQQGGQNGQPGGQSAQAGDQGGGQDGAGQGGRPGGAGRGASGEQRQVDRSGRLGVPGQPVPLDANGPGEGPAEPSSRPPTTSEVVPGTTGGGDSSGAPVQIGADPLRVPLDERDVVQEYFQP